MFDPVRLRAELRSIAAQCEMLAGARSKDLTPFQIEKLATAIGALHTVAATLPDYIELPPWDDLSN